MSIVVNVFSAVLLVTIGRTNLGRWLVAMSGLMLLGTTTISWAQTTPALVDGYTCTNIYTTPSATTADGCYSAWRALDGGIHLRYCEETLSGWMEYVEVLYPNGRLQLSGHRCMTSQGPQGGGYNAVPKYYCASSADHVVEGMCVPTICPAGYVVNPLGTCSPLVNKYDLIKPQPVGANSCVGNPIYPLTGIKREFLDTGVSLGGKPLVAIYATTPKAPASQVDSASGFIVPASFGALWKLSFHHKLSVSPGLTKALLSRSDDKVINFTGNGAGVFTTEADNTSQLVSIPGGYRFTDAMTGEHETYDSNGNVLSIVTSNGRALSFGYNNGKLTGVQSDQGRTIGFGYTNEVISGITGPDGNTVSVAYDGNGNLSELTWQDGEKRKLVYESAGLPWALTGVVDETNTRYATFGYDAQGRAISTEHAGGVGRYSVSYAQPPQIMVVDSYDATANVMYRHHYWQTPTGVQLTLPNASTSSLDSVAVNGMPALTSQSQPAGSGCAASTSTLIYDANGNKASEDDFNGKRVCYANDLSRNLETSRVEGLAGGAGGAACSTVTGTRVSLPSGSRKVSTSWHPDWRLPVQQAEPGKLTSWIYNGQPDPFNGGALASCAPSSALLPSGKPIAVLCKQVEQATTDTDGHLGFAAALQSTVLSRTRSWTYNATGQVLTETNPRSQVTSYAYYSSTTTDHTLGDLQSVTNAAVQTTTFDKYDKNGQLLQGTDANGVVTLNTYDLRGRLLTASVGGQTTSYTYDPVGQLIRITLPDTSWIGYEYDAAHRRTATLDSQGNRIELTLDNQGNVTAQSVKDPGGALRRALGQVIDALGRVQQSTGGI